MSGRPSITIASLITLLAGTALFGGCRLLPPNYLGAITAEQAGHPPKVLRFTHGAIVREPGVRDVALLTGAEVALLFDCSGPTNRAALLFCSDGEWLLYERIGERLEEPVTAGGLGQVGIRVREIDHQTRGSIDVFVAWTERDELQPTGHYQHHPRVLRLVGYFAVPQHPANEEVVAFARDPGLEGRPLVDSLAALTGPRRDRLPRLPIIDVKYLVPTTLVDRLGDLP